MPVNGDVVDLLSSDEEEEAGSSGKGIQGGCNAYLKVTRLTHKSDGRDVGRHVWPNRRGNLNPAAPDRPLKLDWS